MHLTLKKSFTFHRYYILAEMQQNWSRYFRQPDSLPCCFICLFLSPSASIYFVLPLCQLKKEGNVVVFSYLSSLHCGMLFCSVRICARASLERQRKSRTEILQLPPARGAMKNKGGRDTHANTHTTPELFSVCLAMESHN